jgi:hypothetical protein
MNLRKPFEGWLISDSAEPLDDIVRERRTMELSRQMTRLVDVLYALVLVQGAVYYRSLFTLSDEFHHPSRFLPVVLALILVYFTAIQSFIDYHLASEDQPYQILDEGKRGFDLWRFYLDILIVGIYSFLLLKCHVLLSDPGADLVPVFWTFPVIFALYLGWGELRRKAKGSGDLPYKRTLLVVMLILYAFLAAGYAQTASGWRVNAGFLGGALALMLFYRWMNWAQNKPKSLAEPVESPT